jgi:hypothetical protein
MINDMTVVPKNRAAAQPSRSRLDRSQTLRRDTVKRPVGEHEASPSRGQKPTTYVVKSPMVKKFVQARPSDVLPGIRRVPLSSKDTGTPVQQVISKQPRARKKLVTSQVEAIRLRQQKEKLISDKLAAIEDEATPSSPKPRHRFGVKTMVVVSLVIALLAGGLAYANMPGLSVSIASAQAGVNARFPSYHPDGYSLDGPVSYSSGEVAIKFKSNTNNHSYTISQRTSNWDSGAVLDNFVTKKSSDYLTYNEQGLTIYTYNKSSAAWVNGGVFYSIDSNAPLSSDQILKIAASL